MKFMDFYEDMQKMKTGQEIIQGYAAAFPLFNGEIPQINRVDMTVAIGAYAEAKQFEYDLANGYGERAAAMEKVKAYQEKVLDWIKNNYGNIRADRQQEEDNYVDDGTENGSEDLSGTESTIQ